MKLKGARDIVAGMAEFLRGHKSRFDLRFRISDDDGFDVVVLRPSG